MTIAIGFRFHKGVLICADSQYTVSGILKMSGKKIFRAQVGQDRLVFGIAGSVPFGKMAIEKCVRQVAMIPANERTKSNQRQSIEKTLLNIHQEHIYIHPEFRKPGGPEFELILTTWSHLDGLDFFYTSDTALNEITNYYCLGYGSYLAQFVIQSIFRHKGLALHDAVRVAVHVLHQTKEHVDSCGGGSQFAYLMEDGKMSSIHGVDVRVSHR